ncbi:MAG: histidine kinase [Bacteroidetes bacterium]|nr:histidine kinase [Bacteroidota bacterium]
MNFGFSLKVAALDSLVSNVQLLAACWMVSNILRFYMPQKELYWYILFLSLSLSSLVLPGIKVTIRPFLSEGEQAIYLPFIARSYWIRFGVSFLLIGCMTIISILWYMLEEEQEIRQRKIDTEKLSKEAELYKLRQQLQPHFLFNSLNSISALVVTQPERARTMIQQLSDFLRGTLKKEEQHSIRLDEEMQYLLLYLDIEKVRFGYRLTTVIEKDDACNDMKLPAMLLQPIVENAIKFGLYDTVDEVVIRITANAVNNHLVITVQNPFDPETSYPKQGTGFGLNSIKRRLYLLYARNDLLETKAENNLFTTIVKIPQTK